MDFTLHCTLDKHGDIRYRSRNPGILENFSAPDGLSRRWILGILCLIFCRFFSPLPSHLPLLELSIAPCSFLVALSRALCTRANLDCFRYTIPLLPPPSLTFRFSRRFVSIGYFRPSVVVVVVAISLGPISRRGDWETTRTCVCVCVCVLNRVEFELILITNREVVYIFGTDSDGGEMEDGVWKFMGRILLRISFCIQNEFFCHSWKWLSWNNFFCFSFSYVCQEVVIHIKLFVLEIRRRLILFVQ